MTSIRTKIFFGCISLTFVTIFVGFLSQGTQTQLGETTLRIYDNAFQSMNYLRSAQSIILGVSRDSAVGETNKAIAIDQLQSALDALEIARERSMSSRGEELAKALHSAVSDLQATFRDSAATPSRGDFQAIEQAFDLAVGIYASDGFHLRRSAEALVEETRLKTTFAMLGSIATAVLITLLLSRAIVPSIRRAATIATAIASGKLDNPIVDHGSGETGALLQALATMQGGIAEKIARIEALMARQASSHQVEITSQNARFEAALDHMTLGLRMFDADNALLVQNRRFSELFETLEAADALGEASLPMSSAAAPGLDAGSRSYHCRLDDGRTIAVSEEAMEGGGRVVTYDDITDRQRAEAHLAHMARHDALTGLPNRVLFREHLQATLGDARLGGCVSVLCLDLDRFKTVNDTLGHPVGDALLCEAAARLLRTSGSSDMVVRLGGDEFAVIQRSAGPSDAAARLAERLIDILAMPFDIDGHHITVGASIGIVAASDALATPDDLLKSADLALYTAKAEGRGAYRVFEPEMNDRVQERRSLEIDLRAAIGDDQFELHYQPLIDARSGAVVSFEALLRWRHPRRGTVSPADFIPLAEETGLIPAIGLWVLHQACRDAAAWPDGVKVAINLSPLQFRYRDLVDDVEGALRRSGLRPSRLDLEITESLMLQNSDVTLSILHDLRALGICISMDDFGTGYSSLSYLRRFPFDKIKIDRSFIQDLVESGDGLAIVKAVIGLGDSLKMTVVAEGVETEEQRDLLCAAGCQQLQGYLFSKPQPVRFVKGLIEKFAGAHPKSG